MDTMTPQPNGQGKIVSARAAVSRIRKGSTVATGGFVGIGFPENIAVALEALYLENQAQELPPADGPSALTLVYAAGQGDGKERGLNHLGHDGLVARVLAAVDAAGGVALITADHGNADEMFELDKKTKLPAQNKDGSFKAKTAHTLNPVPLILFDKVSGGKLGLKQTPTAGLSSIAATVANLLGLEKHAKWDEGVLEVK
mgnify:CR=1 FL=1